jgi:IclR family KDG regulon transcriptional repressor
LDCFTQDQPELGVREAARLIHLSSSTTGRLMSALKDLGLLNQNPKTHTYSLGGKVLSWSGVYTAMLDVRTMALPYIEELHRATQETISLYVIEGNDRMCVERIESPQNVRIVARIGRRLPLYAGSAGKVLLAFLPPERQEEYIRTIVLTPLTAKTIADPSTLRAELAKIRSQGYAISYGEWLIDASGIAAPIFNQSGEITAALTISGPSQRFTEETMTGYIPLVTRVASEISREMGFRKLKAYPEVAGIKSIG